MKAPPGVYVEIAIAAPLERIWQLTQEPGLHQRWDLRFSTIQYLPRPDPREPQRFLYTTRIGFGLSIRGTGESAGERSLSSGEATSALRFASEQPLSLIREGSGYWRYLPQAGYVRFLTWYDYSVRFGSAGRLLDRLFRPLIGWATAWSFDCLRLWAEGVQAPEASLGWAAVHALARVAVAFVFLWHGLVPKLLFRSADEAAMLLQAGAPPRVVPQALTALGAAEIAWGILLLLVWRRRWPLLATAAAMVLALAGVAVRSSMYLRAAFNPVSLNLSVAALALAGSLALAHAPSARRCLRVAPDSAR